MSFVRPEQVPDRVGEWEVGVGDWEVGVGWGSSGSPITLGTEGMGGGVAQAGPRSVAGAGIGARVGRCLGAV